jgi:hypothetical protein
MESGLQHALQAAFSWCRAEKNACRVAAGAILASSQGSRTALHGRLVIIAA